MNRNIHSYTLDQQTRNLLRSLRLRKQRDQSGTFIAQGKRIIETLLQYNCPLINFYVTKQQEADGRIILEKYTHDHLLRVIDEKTMAFIDPSDTPSGFFAHFKKPAQFQGELSHGIVLARLQDPGNAGTIIRTAVALKIPQIILIDCVDVFNSKTVQASAGTIAAASFITMSWESLLHAVGKNRLTALIPQGGAMITHQTPKTFFVVGNEGSGIPKEWIDQCGYTASLAMPGNVESLNAAVAASIALYLSSTNIPL